MKFVQRYFIIHLLSGSYIKTTEIPPSPPRIEYRTLSLTAPHIRQRSLRSFSAAITSLSIQGTETEECIASSEEIAPGEMKNQKQILAQLHEHLEKHLHSFSSTHRSSTTDKPLEKK